MTGVLSGRWTRSVNVLDVLLALVVGAAIESLVWAGQPFGDPIAGPRPLTAVLPLLMALPLVWRRQFPLVVWSLGAMGVALQAVVSHHSAEGLETLAVLCVGTYSVAAYGERRQALAGLVIFVGAYTVYSIEDAGVRRGAADEIWAAAFFGLLGLAAWLAGYVAHNRRLAAAQALRAVELERDRERVLADERGRIAGELHDIVSHNLSVGVLQASGARGRADMADVNGTLEKIEASGRTALVEMRRMLGVLRAADPNEPLTPQPGIRDIGALVDGVRLAGLDVDCELEGDFDPVPPAVGLSAYRIVQEALTNTMKHADASGARVVVRRHDGAVEVEIADRSERPPAPVTPGHGLSGMQERVALLGGELLAGWDPTGFVVRARLPIDGTVQ